MFAGVSEAFLGLTEYYLVFPCNMAEDRARPKNRTEKVKIRADLKFFSGFNWVFRSSGGFYMVLMILLGFHAFYCVLPCFTGFYWGLLCFIVFFSRFYWVITGLYKGSLGLHLAYPKFYWVLLGSTWS